MKAGWLSKHFGAEAGVVAGLLAATAATAATIYIPYHTKEIVAQAPEVKAANKPKPAPAKPAPPKPQSASLFLHISDRPVLGYEIYAEGFCKEFADQCGGQGSASAIMYRPETLALLRAVNEGVNQAVEYKSDRELFGVTGKYVLPVTGSNGILQGDCEDHALLKRKILAERGVPRETMMIALLRVNKSGNDHAVLIVRTTGGDYALDNRHDDIKRVKDLIDSKEYTFLFLSRPENDRALGGVVYTDDRDDTANLNRNGVRPAAVRGAIPTVEDIRLALMPPNTQDAQRILVAEAQSPVLAAPAPALR